MKKIVFEEKNPANFIVHFPSVMILQNKMILLNSLMQFHTVIQDYRKC